MANDAGRPTLDGARAKRDAVKFRELHLALNHRLREIAELLAPEYKLTLVARHPTNENGHVVTSDDDLADAARVLLHGRLPVVQGPAPSAVGLAEQIAAARSPQGASGPTG